MTEVVSASSRDAWADLPTPAKVEAYERVAPGTAARMLALVEDRQRHAQQMERSALRIRLVGYACAFLSVVTLAALSKHFADVGAPVEGSAIMITGAVSLVGIFVTGRVVANRGARGAGRNR